MNEHQSFVSIFTAIGILTIIGGAYFAYTQISFLNGCEKVRGTVVDIVWEMETENGEEVEYSYPIFEFVDANGSGSTILARGSVGSNPPDYHIGDVVDILYDPEHRARGPRHSLLLRLSLHFGSYDYQAIFYRTI